MAGAGSPYQPLIDRAAQDYGVDPGLIASVMGVESGGNPAAVSPAGAQGLMQIMPGTARELGLADPFDPEANIMAGTRYLRQMLDRYNGDTYWALAAYNAGPGTVDAVRAGRGTLPAETRNYVAALTGGHVPDGGTGGGDGPEGLMRALQTAQRKQEETRAGQSPFLALQDAAPAPAPLPPAEPVESFEPPEFDWIGSPSRLLAGEAGASGGTGISFVDAAGTRQRAYPESAEEARQLTEFLSYSPRQRGQLISVAPLFRKLKSQVDSNGYLRYPDHFDATLRQMIRDYRGNGK
jgi:hypothetical protein